MRVHVVYHPRLQNFQRILSGFRLIPPDTTNFRAPVPASRVPHRTSRATRVCRTCMPPAPGNSAGTCRCDNSPHPALERLVGVLFPHDAPRDEVEEDDPGANRLRTGLARDLVQDAEGWHLARRQGSQQPVDDAQATIVALRRRQQVIQRGRVARRLSASTFAWFQTRAPREVSASWQSAARTAGTLLAASAAPVPVQQQMMPSSTAPSATLSPSFALTSGQSPSGSPSASGP